ncbi:carboxymuconolactone decarboxylase family protein [Streptomyces mutabilis]|uniref:Alkylhydroperoxidase n=2 Tax=Streptomyces mutabilis TaxID=67332 RepID=A0A086MRM3_9ACTN|nr:carboxymuconolactone decarboxylase family protein [Streptomyces mutabilis]KFG71541.1 alkylhydroperoxidase [Streptomyces mutabilis]KFG71570.1 alkylhydroperoxidase [Streptomyces mutabilis]GGQ55184.1 alkyl hydroperoxide reductase AhpD [Streptomyces mutabilis]
MSARLNLFGSEIAGKAMKGINTASMAVINSGLLPKATIDLVLLRASQINGCGFCTDIHSKDLAHAGESAARVNLVAAWREATVFSEAERAALELAEQGTRIADGFGGVPQDVWANAAKHYDEEQLAALTCLIALINASNRLGVITAQPGGEYQPGQFG